jgi:hypothetical protein
MLECCSTLASSLGVSPNFMVVLLLLLQVRQKNAAQRSEAGV